MWELPLLLLPWVGMGLIRGVSLRGCELSGRQSMSAVLVDVDLSSAVMVGVAFDRAELTRVKLTAAALRKAALPEAILNDVDFSCADLQDAELHSMRGTNVRFDAAAMNRVTLVKSELDHVSMKDAALEHATCRRLHPTESSLADAVLTNVDLSQALLVNVDMRRVNMMGAVLSHAPLSGIKAHGWWGKPASTESAAYELTDLSLDGDDSHVTAAAPWIGPAAP